MTVAGGAAGYVRIAGATDRRDLRRRGARAKPSAAAGGVKPTPVRLERGDRLRPRRAAAFARRLLAHDAARTRARRRGGDGSRARAARARHACRSDDEVSRWPTRSRAPVAMMPIVRAAELSHALDGLQTSTNGLTASANGFARAMSQAFTQSVVGGKQFDDVLKSLALRLSSVAVSAAFKPLASGIGERTRSFVHRPVRRRWRQVASKPRWERSSRSRRRRDRHAELFSAVVGRARACRRGRPGGDHAADARTRRAARRRRRTAAARRQRHDPHRDARSRQLPPLRKLPHRPDRARGRARPAQPVRTWISQHDRRFSRGAVSARHRAQERGRAGAANRDRHAGSGREERNARWAHSRRRYDAGYGVKTLEALSAVVAFFEERRGRLYGFRWRDRLDHSSAAPARVDAARSGDRHRRRHGERRSNWRRPTARSMRPTGGRSRSR